MELPSAEKMGSCLRPGRDVSSRRVSGAAGTSVGLLGWATIQATRATTTRPTTVHAIHFNTNFAFGARARPLRAGSDSRLLLMREAFVHATPVADASSAGIEADEISR